jgi:prevent-host-death family protein
MSDSFSLLEARANLGDLVIRAQGGEPVIITRYGKPAAVLMPVGEQAHTIDLPSGGSVTLSIPAHVLQLSVADREFVFDLIDRIKKYEAQQAQKEGTQ